MDKVIPCVFGDGVRLHRELGRAKAFVPGHITGLFRILDSAENPIHRGSIGGGFSVAIGTETIIVVKQSPSAVCNVNYNGRLIDAPVTKTVVRDMLKAYDSEMSSVSVHHRSGLTIGAGFGASGAGALGTAIALGKVLDDGISVERAGQFAHIAEVVNRTGLGDVIAQTQGGVEVRTRPGAPGIGEVRRIAYPKERKVVIAGASGIATKAVLSDNSKRETINRAGAEYVADLIKNPSFENLMQCSSRFADASSLMTERVKTVVYKLHDQGFAESSMVMLGDSAFCFCTDDEVPQVRSVMSRYWRSSQVIGTSIAESGGRLIQ